MNHCIKIIKTIVLIFFVIFKLTINTTYATSWPIVTAPNQTQLFSHGYIDSSQCPHGQGKLINGIALRIREENLCYPNCPYDWVWISNSDNQCRNLETDFILQKYYINLIKGEKGATNFSQITAYYGKQGAHQPHIFTFMFSTRPKDHWECYEMNSEKNLITCANDI
jgi:hypothetical protein